MALTREQIQENVNAIVQQGGTDEDIEWYLGTVTVKEPEPVTQTTPKKDEGLLKKIGKAITVSPRGLGSSIGSAIAGNIQGSQLAEEQAETEKLRGDVLSRISEKRKTGGDTSRLLDALRRSQTQQQQGETTIEDIAPSIDKTTAQVLGEAAGTAIDIGAVGGILANKGVKLGSQIFKGSRPLFRGGLASAKRGVKEGTLIGALEGGAIGAQNEEGVLVGATTGGLLGGLTGGAFGGVIGGTNKILSGRAQRKRDILELISKGNIANKELARLDLTDLAVKASRDGSPATARLKGVKKDPLAKQALRQGFDEADVAFVKSMSISDREKALRMLKVAEEATGNKRSAVLTRPSDIVGSTITDTAKHIDQVVKKESDTLNKVAAGLRGKRLDRRDDLISFVGDSLDNIGATGKIDGIDFTGSTLEGLGSNEKVLSNVYKRMINAEDALDFHNIKKFIDSSVDFGRSGQGLTGESERLLKSWRRSMDQLLDVQFPEYNKTNTVLSENLSSLRNLNDIMGTKFRISDPLSNIKAGVVSSRILSNSPNRGNVISALNNMQQVAKKHGLKSNEDIINQVAFADMVEELFGTQATRSLQGQQQRALEQAAGVAKDIGEKGLVRTGVEKLFGGVQQLRGISLEAKKKALKDLLGIVEFK